MGIQIATLVMEGDYYSLNIGNSNSRVTGKIVDLDFYQNFGLNLRSSDLITLFLPLFNIAENPENASLSRELTTEQYCLSWADSQQVHQVWADPLRPVFLRELVSSQSGDTIRYREIEDVKKRSGVYFPSSWEVRFGQGTEAVSLELDFAQIKVNSGLSRTDFHLDIENVQDSVEVNLGQ